MSGVSGVLDPDGGPKLMGVWWERRLEPSGGLGGGLHRVLQGAGNDRSS